MKFSGEIDESAVLTYRQSVIFSRIKTNLLNLNRFGYRFVAMRRVYDNLVKVDSSFKCISTLWGLSADDASFGSSSVSSRGLSSPRSERLEQPLIEKEEIC